MKPESKIRIPIKASVHDKNVYFLSSSQAAPHHLYPHSQKELRNRLSWRPIKVTSRTIILNEPSHLNLLSFTPPLSFHRPQLQQTRTRGRWTGAGPPQSGARNLPLPQTAT